MMMVGYNQYLVTARVKKMRYKVMDENRVGVAWCGEDSMVLLTRAAEAVMGVGACIFGIRFGQSVAIGYRFRESLLHESRYNNFLVFRFKKKSFFV